MPDVGTMILTFTLTLLAFGLSALAAARVIAMTRIFRSAAIWMVSGTVAQVLSVVAMACLVAAGVDGARVAITIAAFFAAVAADMAITHFGVGQIRNRRCRDPECREAVASVFRRNGVEFAVSASPPRFQPPVGRVVITCRHGADMYAEPTNDQILRWRERGRSVS